MTPRSGATATTTFTPACSRPTATTTLPAITCRDTPAETERRAARDFRARSAAPIAPLAQMCGEDSRDIAGLPVDQIQQAIQPNDEQRAALDDLANASVKAAQDIKAACPTDIALTAPDRLAAMQQRIEAMISAVATVQPRAGEILRPLKRRAEGAHHRARSRTAAKSDRRKRRRARRRAAAKRTAQRDGMAEPPTSSAGAPERDAARQS